MWISLQRILSKKVRGLGLENELKFYSLKKEWDEILKKTLGSEWSKKSRPIKLKNKCLVVGCLNSVWANELQMREASILKNINRSIRNEIEKIRFIN